MLNIFAGMYCLFFNSRSHLSIDIVLVEDTSPTTSSHLIVKGAVVL